MAELPAARLPSAWPWIRGVGRVAVDHVAGQHLHVAGDVQRRGLVEDLLQVAEFRGVDHAVGAHAAEDLDHVLPADRAVGVEALDELRQGRVLQARRNSPATVTVAVPVTEPLLAVTVQAAALLGAVNSPAALIVPPLALQVNVC